MTRTHNRYDLGVLSSNTETVMKKSSAFQHITVTLIGTGSAALTLKCYSSNSVTVPDLSAAASTTNEYTGTQITNLDTGANVSGSVGVVYAGSSDGVTRYEVNDNGNDWIGFQVTGYTAGSVEIKIDMTDNQ